VQPNNSTQGARAMMSLLELFVSVDDFCQVFLPFWEQKLLDNGSNKRRRAGQLSVSEIMTIIIYFYRSHYRNFKAYYTNIFARTCERRSRI
jgi:hypothetical protein